MGLYRFDVANKAGSCHYRSGCPAVLGSNPEVHGAAVPRGRRRPLCFRQQLRVEELTERSGPGRESQPQSRDDTSRRRRGRPGRVTRGRAATRVSVGETRIDIDAVDNFDSVDRRSRPTSARPSEFATATLADLGPTPEPERLANWFERVIGVLRHAAASTGMFHRETARAVVDGGAGRGARPGSEGYRMGCCRRVPRTGGTIAGGSFSRAVLDEVEDGHDGLRPGKVRGHGQPPGPGRWWRPLDRPVRRLGGGRGLRVRMRPTGGGQVAVSPLERRSCGCWPRSSRRVAPGRSGRSGSPSSTRPNRPGFLDQDPAALDVGTRRSPSRRPTFAVRRGWLDGSESAYFDLSRDIMEQSTGRIAEHGGLSSTTRGRHPRDVERARRLPDHAEKACLAALAMHAEMSGLNRRWAETSGPVGTRDRDSLRDRHDRERRQPVEGQVRADRRPR